MLQWYKFNAANKDAEIQVLTQKNCPSTNDTVLILFTSN